MDKYDVKHYNLKIKSTEPSWTDAQRDKYNKNRDKLRNLGVYTSLYTDSIQFPEHPDGIHHYRADAWEAQKLVMADQELPQDLLDRLAYYKPIVDELLGINGDNKE